MPGRKQKNIYFLSFGHWKSRHKTTPIDIPIARTNQNPASVEIGLIIRIHFCKN